MYQYFVVRGEATYRRTTNTLALGEFLIHSCGLVRETHCLYVSNPPAAWASVVVATADVHGNYATRVEPEETANMVEIICTEEGGKEGRRLADAIAAHLGWEAHSADLDESLAGEGTP